MNPKKSATDPLARYLRDLEFELKRRPGVVPEDAIADAREHLALESTTTAMREPGLSIDEYYERLQESFGTPADVADDYSAAAAPVRESPGYAPGFRIRCTRCGRSAQASQASLTRIAAQSTQKYIIGFCTECRSIRWLRLTRDLDETNLTGLLDGEATPGEQRRAFHSPSPWRIGALVLAILALAISLRFAVTWLMSQ